MKISRDRAIQILRQHGLTQVEDTGFKDGKVVPNTSFSSEFGLSLIIDVKRFYAWLGY